MGLLLRDIAVVTGAAHGIGRSIALKFASEGALLVIADRNEAGAQETAALIRAEGGTAIAIGCDVSDHASCRDLAQTVARTLGPVSVLVNNAGILRFSRIGEATYRQDWADTFKVNVDGPMNMVDALLDQLKATRGRIVNVCSTSAFVASDTASMYAASKGAVAQLTRALAVELGCFGIRVNAIAPGVVLTGIGGKEPDEAFMRRYSDRTPLVRLAGPDDMAGPALFLASPLAGHVTATILPVDGGFTAVSQIGRRDDPA